MNAPTRFGLSNASRWESKVPQNPLWEVVFAMRERARDIVKAEPEPAKEYDNMTVTDLWRTSGGLRRKIISYYFDPSDHLREHKLDDWIEHFRAEKITVLMDEAIQTNLAKYGIEQIDFPFIYKVDEQYARLIDKSTDVVKRFQDFNTIKEKKVCAAEFLVKRKQMQTIMLAVEF